MGMYACSRSVRAQVLDLLREFVDNRGVEVDPAARSQRRPRTCFFSSAEPRDPPPKSDRK